MLRKFFKKTKKEPFSIVQDSDGYYIVRLHYSYLAYIKDYKKAKELIDTIEPLYTWGRVSDITELYNKDIYSYQKIAYHLRLYGVPHNFNGNYISSLNNGKVEYKLNDDNRVIGSHLREGFAFREQEENVLLDSVYYGGTIVIFTKNDESEKNINTFLKEMHNYFQLNNPENVKKILQDEELIAFVNDLAKSVEKGDKTFPEPPLKKYLYFMFDNLGGTKKFKREVFVDSYSQLMSMLGLKKVKKEIEKFIKSTSASIQLDKQNIKTNKPSLHSLFLGNAGTGKTEVARLYARLLWSIEYVKNDTVIEVSKEDLVGTHIGETEKKTKSVVDEAMDGVLFIDEAYTLYSKGKADEDFGKIALEVIMREMENNRDDLVVIFAGYEREMDELLKVNQGLDSRFDYKFFFEDFNIKELVEISISMIQKQGFDVSDAEEHLERVIKAEMDGEVLPGNARSIRKIVNRIIENHKISISTGLSEATLISNDDILELIKKDDDDEETILMREKAMNKLFGLIGLEELKNEIQTWSNYIKIEKMRFGQGITNETPTLHMTFEGDPGTGKTTVARIIGEVLKYNGLLSRGHFKETSRSELVGEHMGKTAINTKNTIHMTKGGVLFIDEAYSLVQGDNDAFGKEAVDTLIAEMENNRDDLVVILAGYEKEIQSLLDSNSGFKSRIAKRFYFPNYSSEELYELFKLRMNELKFNISKDVKDAAKNIINKKVNEGSVDGNGRWVRNFVDEIKMNQANRIIKEESTDIQTIKIDDLPV